MKKSIAVKKTTAASIASKKSAGVPVRTGVRAGGTVVAGQVDRRS